MDFNDYQREALRTAKAEQDSTLGNLVHASLGLATESGEFSAEVWATVAGAERTEAMRAHMVEELGDVLWYCALGCYALDTTMNAAFAAFSLRYGTFHTLTTVALALSTASGAFTTEVKRMARYGKEMTPEMAAHMVEEIGNVIASIHRACRPLGTTLESIAAGNVAKLRKRFPEGFTNEAAEARADKGGADARTS